MVYVNNKSGEVQVLELAYKFKVVKLHSPWSSNNSLQVHGQNRVLMNENRTRKKCTLLFNIICG